MSGLTLDLAKLQTGLRTTAIGREFDYQESVSSTNDVALAAGSRHGLVVVAEEQTAGRGRHGSRWTTPKGLALTFSVVVASSSPASAQVVTMAVSVALAGLLRSVGIAGAHIKWPNDILVGRSKIAGTLCEARTRGGSPEVIVCGIGLNVNQLPEQLPTEATSIRLALGRVLDRAELLAELLNRLEVELNDLESAGVVAMLSRWEGLSVLHRQHRVRYEIGGRQGCGTTIGLAADGSLCVELADGSVERIIAGSVRFEP